MCAPPIVKDRIAWSVGLSVGLSPSEPCKNGRSDPDAVCVDDSSGPKERPVAYSGPLRPNTVLCSFSLQPFSYCWNHLKDIPLACTLRTRNIPKFSVMSDAGCISANVRPLRNGTVNTALLLVAITGRRAVIGFNVVLLLVARRHVHFEWCTVLWAFHTIQPSQFSLQQLNSELNGLQCIWRHTAI